jgi:1-aminocyclopropane-1-carboxylate deaminase/D-cysteine desulfhydrase-like pyridoxal-dependent ACC family enzyme
MRRVPTWTPDPTRFPRFPLLDGPSPLHPLPRLSAALGDRAEIWIKREDLLPIALGGNKLRNLEFLVGHALAEGANCLVTSGRRWSNHARLTAAAGATARLGVHLVLSGPPTDPPGPAVRLSRELGATVEVTETGERSERDAAVERVTARLREAGRRPYVIGVGGSGLVGAIGQVLAGIELAGDAEAVGFTPDEVVLASASGGTQAGLLAGLATARLPTRVLGFAAAHPGDRLRPGIAAILAALARLPAIAPVPETSIVVDDLVLGRGYGVPTTEADEAARLLATTEGILADPIYTAKAVAGLVMRIRSGALDGKRVVFWHAGGTPGLFEPLPSA